MPIIPYITHHPRDWASEMRRLHGRGHARVPRSGWRVLARLVLLAAVSAAIVLVVIML